MCHIRSTADGVPSFFGGGAPRGIFFGEARRSHARRPWSGLPCLACLQSPCLGEGARQLEHGNSRTQRFVSVLLNECAFPGDLTFGVYHDQNRRTHLRQILTFDLEWFEVSGLALCLSGTGLQGYLTYEKPSRPGSLQ